MFNTNNNVTPLTWRELREGYKYLLSENLMIPEYRIKLQYIDNCFINGCYINKINLLPKFDILFNKVLTAKIDLDFIDMAICPNHALPLLQINIFENTSQEIAYLMSAASLVKLKNYDFSQLIKSCLGEGDVEDKKSKSSFIKVVYEINNKIKYKVERHNNKERLNNYSKAKLGLLTDINDLRSALNYAIEIETINDLAGNNALELVINEITNIYKDYQFTNIYKDYKVTHEDPVYESKQMKDFANLNSNFNRLARERVVYITGQLKNKYKLPQIEECYQLILKNYHPIKTNFIKNNSNYEENQLFVVLKSSPNQNNLFNNQYINLESVITYMYIIYDLLPNYEEIYVQDENYFGGKRFIAKITLDDLFKLNLFFESIIESDIYPEDDKSMVMDATVFWNNDVKSPYYFFDDAFLVAKNI
jgi:hypothetical protein